MVGGIIVAASADQEVLAHPAVVGRMSTTWMVIGGSVLFLVGHVLFKRVIWGVISWPRVAAIAILVVLLLPAPHLAALALNIVVVLVLLAVAVGDRIYARRAPATEAVGPGFAQAVREPVTSAGRAGSPCRGAWRSRTVPGRWSVIRASWQDVLTPARDGVIIIT